jgi:hypothetical protein
MKMKNQLFSGLMVFALASCGGDSSTTPTDKDSVDAASTTETVAAIPVNPLKDCYFGDLHLHTSLSADANFFSVKTLPEDSYEYAMGNEVDYLGQKIKRNAPLDFLAVTDHAEYLGVVAALKDPKGPFVGSDLYKLYNSTNKKDLDKVYFDYVHALSSNKADSQMNNVEVMKSVWKRIINAANKYNYPGKFTALVGFEWTSMPAYTNGSSQNLHRCIIFKGDKVPELPYSSFESEDPENLWTYLENARKTGDDVIAIPHNGNISNGLMFDTKTLSGKPLTTEYAHRRMANEPLTEMGQGKGTSESHGLLSPNDEFVNFETFETLLGGGVNIAKYKTGSYIRQAYGVGQELQAKLGINPFKYGLEGGTDYHSGFSSTEENNYPGSHGMQDALDKNYKDILLSSESVAGEPPTKISAGNLTGVWAENNTRNAIFDALKRKECFATSGNRIKVRMFAGWDYNNEILKAGDWVKQAYASGVPMGADLVARGTSGKPRFLVQALKDPNGGNLDRIQIIKVSTKNGKSTEKIYDVIWSGDRKKDAKGKVPAVGTTVDIKTATYTNSIGVAELFGFWEDTDFDPSAYVTYYARVLEIPTPRWSTYLAAKHNMDVNKSVDATIQERAWTSPIWYVPAK